MPTTLADVLITQVESLAERLTSLFPWVKELTAQDQVAFLADLTAAYGQMVHDGDRTALLTVLEDWEATAQVLRAPDVAHHLQGPKAATEYVPWETVDADLPRDPAP
jgi:hypothetical protein